MKDKRIAIISVLKPVDETRMTKKMGLSLAEAGYEVHVAGFRGNGKTEKVFQYPLFDFNRTSIKRLFVAFNIFRWLLKISPELVIVGTHELLFPAVLYKAIFRNKIVYDVRENYAMNIILTDAFPRILRGMISHYVRLKERVLSRFIDHFFLAEKGYILELDFIKNNYTVLENKALPNPFQNTRGEGENIDEIRLIFTGTIATSTGVFECIDMAEKLHNSAPEIKLIIAGYCHIPEVWKKLQKLLSTRRWITVFGGMEPIAHDDILSLINSADAAFIFYPDKTLVRNKFPTKLYEYLSLQKPILMQPKKSWLEVVENYPATIPVNPSDFHPEQVLEMLKKKYYYRKTPGDEVLWKGEAKRMLAIMNELII